MKSRIRMIAGPNGSGKTTLLEYLHREFEIQFGFDLNPDKIEAELRATGRLPLSNWGVTFNDSAFRDAVSRQPLAKHVDSQHLSVRDNAIEVGELPPMSYLAAIISDILRRTWIAQGDSFVFETVMSSADKVDLLAAAKARGYRTYLYYICTDAAVINQQRVLSRVELGGHSVSPEKIAERYDRSLALLPSAIATCDRAYLFDNSESVHRLVAEFEGGRSVHLHSPSPEWFIQAVLKNA